MWEAAVKRHEDALIEKGIEKGIDKGMLLKDQHTLIDQMNIKFGKSITTEKKIRSCTNIHKLDMALRKILFASSKQEVLSCLD